MIITVVVVSILLLLLGYIFYGRFLANHLQLNDSNPTPACTINDGVDYVPAKPVFLLGQHLSAISAAGPIVGPILAALWFGWLPALIWIVIGAMLLEGLLAVLALATVMMLPKGSDMLKEGPNLIYANGIAKYLDLIGINFKISNN